MRRAIVFCILGMLVGAMGASAAHALRAFGQFLGNLGVVGYSERQTLARTTKGAFEDPRPIETRLALIGRVQGTRDLDALAAMLASTAEELPGVQRDLQLALLLTRIAELDPQLNVLKMISRPAAVDAISVALLGVVGHDEDAVRRIAKALPTADVSRVQLEALMEAARRDPVSGLRRVLLLEPDVARRSAIAALASMLAQDGPIAALDYASFLLDPELRRTFESQILAEWAEADAAGVLAYIERLDSSELTRAATALESLVWSNPERALPIARRMLRDDETLYTSAIAAVTERNPDNGVNHLNGLDPHSEEYQLARLAVSAGYAARDPRAALQWAETHDAGTVGSVLRSIAQSNLETAFDLALKGASASAGASSGYFPGSWLTRNDAGSFETMAKIGARLMTEAPQFARPFVGQFAEAWSVADPVGALRWASSNGDIGSQMVPYIAVNFGSSRTFERALTDAASLPEDDRHDFLKTLVTVHGLNTRIGRIPEAVIELASRFEGTPDYSAVLPAIASIAIRTHPRGGEGLMDALPQGPLRREIQKVLEERTQ